MTALPAWAEWNPDGGANAYTLGVEEEVMLVDPADWSLAPRSQEVMGLASAALTPRASAETHRSALELATGAHPRAAQVRAELLTLRRELMDALGPPRLRAAGAGLHPFTEWSETLVSRGERYRAIHESMRELARREPTFALHVHVGVPDPEAALELFNRMRAHLPVILALSANSPFWQGRDSGLASARIPLFQGFPRVGIPRAFASYAQWASAVDLLIRCRAFPEPTFLWWDVRLQPRYGTVEVRIADAQTTVRDAIAIAALVQCLARLEIEQGHAAPELVEAPEALEENRFLAARDGMEADLLAPERGGREPARAVLGELLDACGPHARELGCERELADARSLAAAPPAERQREIARLDGGLEGVVERLAEAFGAESGGA